MKKYQCHKIVEAARIDGIEKIDPTRSDPFGQRLLQFEAMTAIDVKGRPQFDNAEVGGYYVVYDSGTYASYSPAKAFEEGYTEIVDSPGTASSGASVVTDTRDAKPAAPTGPRVTLEDIHDAIESEHYFSAWDGVHGNSGDDSANLSQSASLALSLPTFCVLVLKNGYTVTGKSACVSAENFDANMGRKYAHEDAIEACWPLFGFALKDRLHRNEDYIGAIVKSAERMAASNEAMQSSLSNISIVDSSMAGTFGYALAFLKRGAKIARAGWNGKGMFAYLVPANTYPAQTGAAKSFFGAAGMVPYNAYMVLKGSDDTVSTWAPSGSDSLAEDWIVLPG